MGIVGRWSIAIEDGGLIIVAEGLDEGVSLLISQLRLLVSLAGLESYFVKH